MNLSGKKIRKVRKMSSSSYIYSLGSYGKSLVYEHTDSNQERVYTRLSKQGKRLGDLDPNDTITSTYPGADSSYDCGVDNKSYYVTGGKVLCTDYGCPYGMCPELRIHIIGAARLVFLLPLPYDQ